MRDLTIVIPAAGAGRRMRSYGPKALIEIGQPTNRQTILGRQLAIVKKLFPSACVVVVVGFEADRLIRSLPADVVVVENEHYLTTNVARSLEMGVRAAPSQSVLILYGDLVFTPETLSEITPGRSHIWVDGRGKLDDQTVGLNVVDGRVVHFCHGLPAKWAQIAYLTGRELEIFRQLTCRQERRKHFGYEILLGVIDYPDTQFFALEPAGMEVVEVDNSHDIIVARELAQRSTI